MSCCWATSAVASVEALSTTTPSSKPSASAAASECSSSGASLLERIRKAALILRVLTASSQQLLVHRHGRPSRPLPAELRGMPEAGLAAPLPLGPILHHGADDGRELTRILGLEVRRRRAAGFGQGPGPGQNRRAAASHRLERDQTEAL